MFDTQANLLSFSQLHSDVDQLFRAYLDTALMELADTFFGDSRKYWHAVMKLREGKLEYQTSLPTKSRASVTSRAATSQAAGPSPAVTVDEMSVDELIDAMPTNTASSQDTATEGLQYLYWFEVRADYWSRVTSEDLKELIKTLPASNRLGLLYEQARILESRLKTGPSPTKDESGLKGLVWVDPPSAEGLKSLLAKVEPPKTP